MCSSKGGDEIEPAFFEGGYMGRHNRQGEGEDQVGFRYEISYSPDWLRRVRVSRQLGTGRQSSRILFRNPARRRQEEAGERIRTRITSPEQGLDFEVILNDPHHTVRRIRVTCVLPGEGGRARDREVEFTLDELLPPL